MPLTGSGFDQLNLLVRRLSALPGYAPDMIREAVPTVEILLSHATGTVPPASTHYAPRRYEVDAETQERIDENTSVGAEGMTIRVGLAGGDPHERPIVPVGELPLKWRGALFQKINGAIRRELNLQRALGFLRESLTDGVLVQEFNARAKAAGVKGKALREAKKILGVTKSGRGKKARFSVPE